MSDDNPPRDYFILGNDRRPVPATYKEWREEDPPLLYVSSLRAPDEYEPLGHYATWEDAEAGHVQVLRRLGVRPDGDQLDLNL